VSYAIFTKHASAWYGMVVLVGISWAFFSHMASGLRHFVMDVGAGFELDRNALWSVLTPIAGILLTAAFWALVLLR
jgi:succinate dehydrogenase / fumarate reductase cytochrome b subunit